MIQRGNLGCEVEQSGALLEINERVISRPAAVNVCEAVAEFHGLFHVVISLLNTFRIGLLRAATFCRNKEQSRSENKDRGFRKATTKVFEADSAAAHESPSRFEEHIARIGAMDGHVA